MGNTAAYKAIKREEPKLQEREDVYKAISVEDPKIIQLQELSNAERKRARMIMTQATEQIKEFEAALKTEEAELKAAEEAKSTAMIGIKKACVAATKAKIARQSKRAVGAVALKSATERWDDLTSQVVELSGHVDFEHRMLAGITALQKGKAQRRLQDAIDKNSLAENSEDLSELVENVLDQVREVTDMTHSKDTETEDIVFDERKAVARARALTAMVNDMPVSLATARKPTPNSGGGGGGAAAAARPPKPKASVPAKRAVVAVPAKRVALIVP